MPDTVNTLELGWSLWCAFGALAAAHLCWDVVDDARELRRLGLNGIRQRAVRLCVAISGTFVLTLLLFVLIGAVAMTQPQSAESERATPGQIVATLGFCVVAVIVVGVCIYWRRVRRLARSAGLASHLPTTVGGMP